MAIYNKTMKISINNEYKKIFTLYKKIANKVDLTKVKPE